MFCDVPIHKTEVSLISLQTLVFPVISIIPQLFTIPITYRLHQCGLHCTVPSLGIKCAFNDWAEFLIT